MAIKINNNKYKNKILDLIKNAKWLKIYPQIKTPCLYQWQVYKYIKDNIQELE